MDKRDYIHNKILRLDLLCMDHMQDMMDFKSNISYFLDLFYINRKMDDSYQIDNKLKNQDFKRIHHKINVRD
jgi:hypothetical protein